MFDFIILCFYIDHDIVFGNSLNTNVSVGFFLMICGTESGSSLTEFLEQVPWHLLCLNQVIHHRRRNARAGKKYRTE